MPKKPKFAWVGTTPINPVTSKEQKKLHKLSKKRLDMGRRKYPEVRGKVVDYISHSIEDGNAERQFCDPGRNAESPRSFVPP